MRVFAKVTHRRASKCQDFCFTSSKHFANCRPTGCSAARRVISPRVIPTRVPLLRFSIVFTAHCARITYYVFILSFMAFHRTVACLSTNTKYALNFLCSLILYTIYIVYTNTKSNNFLQNFFYILVAFYFQLSFLFTRSRLRTDRCFLKFSAKKK